MRQSGADALVRVTIHSSGNLRAVSGAGEQMAVDGQLVELAAGSRPHRRDATVQDHEVMAGERPRLAEEPEPEAPEEVALELDRERIVARVQGARAVAA